MQNRDAIVQQFTRRADHHHGLARRAAVEGRKASHHDFALAFEVAASVAMVNCMLDTALNAGQSVLPQKLRERWRRMAEREVLKAEGNP